MGVPKSNPRVARQSPLQASELSQGGMNMKMCRWFLVCAAVCVFANMALADSITFGGVITQSTQDGTGPAVNNPSLNNIRDGDAYSVMLGFAGQVTTTGTYDLTGASLVFRDLTNSAMEASFHFISLTVSADGSFDNISLLGCLTTGSGCNLGNELAANFRIPLGSLNSQNVAAQGIPNLNPSLDLLEDDGVTDIQGSVTTYSYIPEPWTVALLWPVLPVLVWKRLQRPRQC